MKADAPVQALSTPRAASDRAKLHNSASLKPLLLRLRQLPRSCLRSCAGARRSPPTTTQPLGRRAVAASVVIEVCLAGKAFTHPDFGGAERLSS